MDNLFSTQLTVRIYNYKILERLKKVYKACNDVFSTKNPFLVECITRGLEAMERDILGTKNIQDISELYDEIHATQEKLNNLILLSEKNAKETIVNLTVNQKLLSCSYNMLLGLSENEPCHRKFIEAGMLDDLPERLDDIIKEIMKFYSKK